MPSVVVDTDVVSFLFKRDQRADLYRPYLEGNLLVISFMSLAELDRWALERNWGETCVWVHDATSAIDSQRRYFQGRRRIPAPIVLRRHMGESDLQTVARELLGLSKMNWNTFNLYTKLPATVHSSNEIARVESLLQRFGPQSYDRWKTFPFFLR